MVKKGHRASTVIHNDLLNSILNAPMSFLHTHSMGDINARSVHEIDLLATMQAHCISESCRMAIFSITSLYFRFTADINKCDGELNSSVVDTINALMVVVVNIVFIFTQAPLTMAVVIPLCVVFYLLRRLIA